ncbi:hypothetical protein D3C73_1045210 [compost metagenome]
MLTSSQESMAGRLAIQGHGIQGERGKIQLTISHEYEAYYCLRIASPSTNEL